MSRIVTPIRKKCEICGRMKTVGADRIFQNYHFCKKEEDA